MRISFLVVLMSVFTPNALADLKSNLSGLDVPVEVKKKVLGKSPYSRDSEIVFSCHVYSSFVVTELDEGQKGASEIAIRPRTENTQLDKLCEKSFQGKTIVLKGVSGYFLGASGDLVFEISADSFGALGGVGIYRASTGKKVFETDFNENKEFVVKNKLDQPQLIYYKPLKLGCVPSLTEKNQKSKKDNKCWDRILRENQVDPSVKIQKPDCSVAIKAQPDASKAPNRSLQITVKVRVEDISKPQFTYLGGDSTCDPTP